MSDRELVALMAATIRAGEYASDAVHRIDNDATIDEAIELLDLITRKLQQPRKLQKSTP